MSEKEQPPRMNVSPDYVSVPCEAWFNPKTGRLTVGIFMGDVGVEDAQREVKSAKVSVADAKGSNRCALDYFPYSEK
ncbi:MAG: hypothetical protein ACXABY_25645 [Candidatus Thorarchaeota archaeon]|jgi:hypothetical protein